MNRVIVSTLRHPATNLAVESALFKSLGPSDRLLYVYINDPCIVIGRNQNPWKEVNLIAAFNKNIPVIRRRSGGGCVVHDPGNVNFCIQTPRHEFSRDKHLHMVINALEPAARQHLQVNERNDITSEGKKVSGSSYKIEKDKSYHHATMLVDSNLSDLREVLHREDAECGTVINARGTESIKSPVANAKSITSIEFIEACVRGFNTLYMNQSGPDDTGANIEWVSPSDITPDIASDADKLLSWEWTYGQTPSFTHRFSDVDSPDVEFQVHKGIIEQASDSQKHLVGQEYRNLTGLSPKIRRAIEPWAAGL